MSFLNWVKYILEHLFFDIVKTWRLLSPVLEHAARNCYPYLLSNHDLQPANQPFSISRSPFSPASSNHQLLWDASWVDQGVLVFLCLVCVSLNNLHRLVSGRPPTSVRTSLKPVWKWSWSSPHCPPAFSSTRCAAVETPNWDSQHPALRLTPTLTPTLILLGFSLQDN